MTKANASLARLLAQLRQCTPAERINLREPILAFGAAAIAPLRELAAAEPDLGSSIVAWLEVLAKRDAGARAPVAVALRGIETSVVTPSARHATQALERLGFSQLSAARARAGPQPVSRAAGTEWTGFQAHEFGRNEGTSWRSADGRESLAPIIVRALRELDPDFMSYGWE